jgi:hypothetical protein
MLLNFYLNNNISFKKILIQKLFAKYIYTKFLILASFKNSKRKSIFFLDNYFMEFSFKLKKKFKRLKYLFKINTGKFLKSNLFLYRYSKLTSIFFFSIRFHSYIKKSLYFSILKLKYLLQNLNLVFFYKSIRGGFLGFSNNILGFFSKKNFFYLKFFIKKNLNFILYKKYFILINILNCIPFKDTNLSTIFIHNAGYIRNFQKIKKKSLRLFFFKRFKFNFLISSLILKKKILFFRKNFLNFKKYNSTKIFFFILKNFFFLFFKKL